MSNENKGEENYSESIPTCPYCKKIDEDYWDGFSESSHWGDYEKYNCGYCEKDYLLMREVAWHAKPSCEVNNLKCDLEEMIIESEYKQCVNCGELQ